MKQTFVYVVQLLDCRCEHLFLHLVPSFGLFGVLNLFGYHLKCERNAEGKLQIARTYDGHRQKLVIKFNDMQILRVDSCDGTSDSSV